MSSCVLETKCWEKDWQTVLEVGRLLHLRNHSGNDASKFLIFINNCDNPKGPATRCELFLSRGVIDGYYVVAEHEKKVLDFFGLTREAFTTGYYYSIAELTALYLCKDADFLCHFASDVLPLKGEPWIADAMTLMEQNPKIKAANLTWNNDFAGARAESFDEHGKWFFSQGFSDQNYLVRVADFRQRIYDQTHPASRRYPTYGGELFEKRVDSWMRNRGCWRATHKELSYGHPL